MPETQKWPQTPGVKQSNLRSTSSEDATQRPRRKRVGRHPTSRAMTAATTLDHDIARKSQLMRAVLSPPMFTPEWAQPQITITFQQRVILPEGDRATRQMLRPHPVPAGPGGCSSRVLLDASPEELARRGLLPPLCAPQATSPGVACAGCGRLGGAPGRQAGLLSPHVRSRDKRRHSDVGRHHQAARASRRNRNGPTGSLHVCHRGR